ncbi:MAG: SpoIIE family protein phosphatase [Rhodothermaceae bacterium]
MNTEEKNINNDDELIFANEDEEIVETKLEGTWKILVVDDEVEIHNVTKMVLEEVEFKNRSLEFIDAFNGKEAKEKLSESNDIALILLDVVMEDEDSGLKVVKFIREELNNRDVRIILRTGYPGQAPEKRIIVDYDINDYKEKTELSSQKLITSVISALRSYEDIQTISELNKNLEKKVEERTRELKSVNEKLSGSLDLISKDLQAGRKIQMNLLPGERCFIDKFVLSRFFKPSLYLSGDFLNYHKLNDKEMLFYFIDVSGHGAASAFVTIFIKGYFDRYVEKYKSGEDELVLDPAQLLAKLNLDLIEEQFDKYLTVFCGIISEEKQELLYVNAGHFPYPVLSNKENQTYLESTSSPVGMFKFTKFRNSVVKLPEMYTIFCSSDGLLDIMPEADLKEKQKKINDLLDNRFFEISEIINYFNLDKLEEVPDDITMLLIKRGITNE